MTSSKKSPMDMGSFPATIRFGLHQSRANPQAAIRMMADMKLSPINSMGMRVASNIAGLHGLPSLFSAPGGAAQEEDPDDDRERREERQFEGRNMERRAKHPNQPEDERQDAKCNRRSTRRKLADITRRI